MAQDRLNYYEILQVTPHAAPEVVKAAHRALTKTMHPDAGGSTALAVAINEAVDVLLDPVKRQRYDMELRIGQAKTFEGGKDRVIEREVYLVICLDCGAKNRLRDSNLVGVKCSGCGGQFLRTDMSRSSTSTSHGAANASSVGAEVKAFVANWRKTNSGSSMGACGHKLGFLGFGSAVIPTQEARQIGIPEWAGQTVCADCYNFLSKVWELRSV